MANLVPTKYSLLVCVLFFCYFRRYCCTSFVSNEIITLKSRWTAFVYLLACVFVCASASNFWQLEGFFDRTSDPMAFFPFAIVIIDFDNCTMQKFVNACKFFFFCSNNANVIWIGIDWIVSVERTLFCFIRKIEKFNLINDNINLWQFASSDTHLTYVALLIVI